MLLQRLSVVCLVLILTMLTACSEKAPVTVQPSELDNELAELAEKSAKKYPPELIEAGIKGIEILNASGIIDSALNVGDVMPDFILNDASGQSINSQDLLRKGPLILVYYRGAWCPYCNLYLHGLQKRLPEFKAHGANLVAISIEPADRSLSVAEKNALEFTVLSDPGLEVARQFGIVYEMPKVTNDAMLSVGFDMAEYNGLEKNELPLSASYVIHQNGRIAYAFLDPDYKKRANPNQLLATLAELTTTRPNQ